MKIFIDYGDKKKKRYNVQSDVGPEELIEMVKSEMENVESELTLELFNTVSNEWIEIEDSLLLNKLDTLRVKILKVVATS